jgi:hypothetical protein
LDFYVKSRPAWSKLIEQMAFKQSTIRRSSHGDLRSKAIAKCTDPQRTPDKGYDIFAKDLLGARKRLLRLSRRNSDTSSDADITKVRVPPRNEDSR